MSVLRSAVERVASECGLDSDALLAVTQVESGGRIFARVRGRNEPLIRFEGHYFHRRLSDSLRVRAEALGLASPRMGEVRNPASQAARWKLLDRACELNRPAALCSTSWGAGQVMGAHWKRLGYESVEALVRDARSGAEGQVRLMARFILDEGLGGALAERDWTRFARGYNGPAHARFGYAGKMRKAYLRICESDSTAA